MKSLEMLPKQLQELEKNEILNDDSRFKNHLSLVQQMNSQDNIMHISPQALGQYQESGH